MNQPIKKCLRVQPSKLSKAKAKTKTIAFPNAAVATKRKSPSNAYEVTKKRRGVLEPWTPDNLPVEGQLPFGMIQHCIQFLIKNNRLPAITFMGSGSRGRVRTVKNDTSRMFLKYVGPNFDSAMYYYRDKGYKVSKISPKMG